MIAWLEANGLITSLLNQTNVEIKQDLGYAHPIFYLNLLRGIFFGYNYKENDMNLICLIFGHKWLSYRKYERHCKRCNAWEVEMEKIDVKKGYKTTFWKRMEL